MNNIEAKFKIGDVVKLKSGSPEMTVSNLDNQLNHATANDDLFTGYVFCQWFVDGKKIEDKFHQDTLEKLN